MKKNIDYLIEEYGKKVYQTRKLLNNDLWKYKLKNREVDEKEDKLFSKKEICIFTFYYINMI